MEDVLRAVEKEVYFPGQSRPLEDGETLEFDKTAYKMLHEFQTEYPCLSFDCLLDDAGGPRTQFPLSCTLVSGTVAEKIRDNKILLMLLNNLTPMIQEESDSEKDDEDEEKMDKKLPIMTSAIIPHHGGINRIRCTEISSAKVVAVWNDQGKVQIWNLNPLVKAVEDGDGKKHILKTEKPVSSFAGHQSEGFALDWSKCVPGQLASGDNNRRIHIWHMGEGGTWNVDQKALTGHDNSVEDIQWSPDESNVFASCSSDATIRLWDARAPNAQACVCTVKNAHESDVNVISWNKKDPFILSGGDDGVLKIWDLKQIQYGEAVAVFKHHSKAITSVEWSPTDSTVFAATGEDNQTTYWDLALEADDQVMETGDKNVAPQLLFMHMGQEEIKEVHWHSQLPGVSITTALNSFNIFKPSNM